MLTRCEQIMSEICTNFEAELREFAGAHDLLLVPRWPRRSSSGVSNLAPSAVHQD